MRPAPFDYHRATSLPDACALLARVAPDGRLLAGGQSLLATMNLRLARPTALVDIGRIPGLDRIAVDGQSVRIGTLVTHAAIARSSKLAQSLPLLPRIARHIAHPAVRNRGTFGGSLANADPASEWPSVLLALGGRVRAARASGERWIEAADFFQAFYTTALEPDEMLSEAVLPVPGPRTRWAFQEYARQAGAFATVLIVAGATLDQGRLSDLRIVVGGSGPTPLASPNVWNRYLGERPTPSMIDDVAQSLAKSIEPRSDIHASAEDRRQMIRALTRRALSEAAGLAGEAATDRSRP